MAVKRLQLIARVARPHFTGLVTGGRDDLVSLRVELNLTNLVLVALQQCRARSSENIINSSNAVRTCSC